MSIRLMDAVWRTSPYEGRKLLVLLALADSASVDNGSCFLLISTLARKAKCSERLVQDALAEFVRDGWVVREQRPGHSSTFYVQVPPVTPTEGGAEIAPDQLVSNQGGAEICTDDAENCTHNRSLTGTTSTTQVVDEVLVPKSAPAALKYEHTWAPPPAAITAVCNAARELSADEHLDHYLARCSELKKNPSGAEWVRWFIKDQNDRRTSDRIAARSAERECDDTGTPLSWR